MLRRKPTQILTSSIYLGMIGAVLALVISSTPKAWAHGRPSEAFKKCMKDKGVPPPPKPSEKQRAAFEECHEQEDPKACLEAKGIRPPQLTEEQRQAMEECRAAE